MSATYTAWRAKADQAYERLSMMVANFQNTTVGQWGSGWRNQPQAVAVIPTTSVATDRTTVGALGQFNGGSGKLRIGKADVSFNHAGGGTLLVIDRLNHSGGMSGTVTTAQTTNIPTAALGRYTTGDGVWIALEVWASLGATLTTVTASYTNQAGTAGRTTEAVNIGGNNSPTERFIILPLQAGDTGARSVESVTVLASTLTAGNFGVTLFKPIGFYPSVNAQATWDPFLHGGALVDEVVDNACLCSIVLPGLSNLNQMQATLHTVED